jgi:DNA-nicking Smr family endonuclease
VTDWAEEPNSLPELDLHGLTPSQALRRLKAELHTCRVRGDSTLTVITGRGFGNRLQQPVLRTQVEAWLDGPDGKGLGVLSWSRTHRGGALEVRLARAGEARRER